MQIAFTPPQDAPRWKRWLLYSAFARIVIFMLAMALLTMLPLLALKFSGVDMKQLPQSSRALIRFGLQTVCAVAAYLLLVRMIEKRRALELMRPGAGRMLALGALLGGGYIAATVASMALAGSYRIVGFNAQAQWWMALATSGIGAAVTEEIMFRGVLFRCVEEAGGTWWALAVSALFFGLVHLGNKNATVWSSLAIAIEAGLMLGAAYLVTRSLPFCMGIHAAWNFTQGMVFGIPVSGFDDKGWIVSERPGPEWLTGGAFGAEASVVAVLLGAAISAVLVSHAIRRGLVIPPSRRRTPIMIAPPSVTA